jgi:hypothetical protein
MARNNFDKVTFTRGVQSTKRPGVWRVGTIRGEHAQRPHANSPVLRDADLFVVNGIEHDGFMCVYWDERRGLNIDGFYVSRLNSFGARPSAAATAALYKLLDDPRAAKAFYPPTAEEMHADEVATGEASAELIMRDVKGKLREWHDSPTTREAFVAKLRALVADLDA